MLKILKKLKEDKSYNNLLEKVSREKMMAAFVPSFLRPFVAAGIYEELKESIVVLTPTLKEAEEFYESILNFTSQAVLFPDREVLPWEKLIPNKEILTKRGQVLYKVQTEPIVVVVAVQTFIQEIPHFKLSLLEPLTLEEGKKSEFSYLLEKLVRMGYERTLLVENRGEFSVRGGIVDIFNPLMEHPVRIEFFGDEVVSLRHFSVASQCSIATCTKIQIFPCQEDEVGGGGCFLDFLKEDALIIFSERKLIENEAEKLYEEQFRAYSFLPPQNLFSKIKRGVNFVSIYPRDSFSLEKIEASLPDVIPGNFDTLREEVKRLSYEGFLILIVLNDKGRIERLSELFLEEGISFEALKEKEEITFKKGVCLATGLLRQGFVLKTVRLAVFGEENIFKKQERRRVLKQTTSTSPLVSLSFSEGDYVVHTVHGIARYGGLCQREMEGIIKDYLLLYYAGEDRLYVPVEQFHRVSKYIGAGGESPKVSRLNSREWLRSKNRAKESAKKLAVDLMKLYSLRASSSGFTFLPDTPWQKELEDSFSFEETLDQFKAVKDVKEDMEIPRPMDRLICGDVGYGKTEVAIRAVFKVVMSGKQVIVLVPTTILAQQHHSTFQSRFFVFPINIEMLSRFKTPKEQKKILLEFALGKIDVLIGTHRLLQKDIIPNDLGLVVVDEEQRFGVAHKEHLKSLRETVDVLTLTATPIPRTLQMALTGVRDISIINTPPEDRLPVFTYVGEFDEAVVQNAIRRELSRNGQIYYVHNRVETIDEAAERVKRLVPEAKTIIAHGQMPEAKLEKVMQEFLEGKYDILICTTIIESGIDISSTNTLIVEEADMFGLSTLYQLKGRVGRSSHRAYAYFFFSPHKVLTILGSERLKTIGEFTELGSGFKIALRDLEIRGAGNLLGPEQHGHIAAVGFDLYCGLLRQEVEKLKGEPFIEPKETKVNLPVSAFIPKSYIESEALRIEAYRRLASTKKLNELKLFELELSDRYGSFPIQVKNLLVVCQVKILAEKLRISEINYKGGRLNLIGLSFSKDNLDLCFSRYPRFSFNPHRKIAVVTVEKEEVLSFTLTLLSDMISLFKLNSNG